MKNIFVGNLDITTTEAELRNLFEAYGAVATVTLVHDRDTNVPRGFAFVEMSDDAQADAAIKGLHETMVGDRHLAINEARPKSAEGSPPEERRDKPRPPLDERKHRRHRY